MVWHQARAQYYRPHMVSPYVPLWAKPTLPHLAMLPDPQLWASRGIVGLKHIISNDRLCSFADLKAEFHLPNQMLFRYLQLRHAVTMQFPNASLNLIPWSVLTSRSLGSLCHNSIFVSPLTKLFSKWQANILDLTEEDWDTCVAHYVISMVSARDRFMQVQFLHSAY